MLRLAWNGESIFKLSLYVAISSLSNLSSSFKTLNNRNSAPTFEDCVTQLDDTLDRLNQSMSAVEVGPGEKMLTESKINDTQTWISAAMMDQSTCFDQLEETEPKCPPPLLRFPSANVQRPPKFDDLHHAQRLRQSPSLLCQETDAIFTESGSKEVEFSFPSQNLNYFSENDDEYVKLLLRKEHDFKFGCCAECEINNKSWMKCPIPIPVMVPR